MMCWSVRNHSYTYDVLLSKDPQLPHNVLDSKNPQLSYDALVSKNPQLLILCAGQ